jgi:hypothetical protein
MWKSLKSTGITEISVHTLLGTISGGFPQEKREANTPQVVQVESTGICGKEIISYC